jgi:hypothetical protein
MSESDERDGAEVLKSLPARRPQRRSARRDGAKTAPAGRKPAPAKAAAKPRAKAASTGPKAATGARKRAATVGKPPAARRPTAVRPSAATRAASSTPGKRPAQSPEGIELVGTAIQAAGELAQLGLTLGTKALRGAVSRIPRP